MLLVLALSVLNCLHICNSVFAIAIEYFTFHFTSRYAFFVQYHSPLLPAIHSTVARQLSFKSPHSAPSCEQNQYRVKLLLPKRDKWLWHIGIGRASSCVPSISPRLNYSVFVDVIESNSVTKVFQRLYGAGNRQISMKYWWSNDDRW